MGNNPFIPKITPCFQLLDEDALHLEIAKKSLAKILPKGLFSTKPTAQEKECFLQMLPIFSNLYSSTSAEKITCVFLAKHQANSFKFFLEMISHWLIPCTRLNIVLSHTSDFYMQEISSDLYTLSEVIIHVEDSEQLKQIFTRLPIIESELKLGLASSHYARKILEVKGLASDEKASAIHEHMAQLMKRFPNLFDSDLLAEMQHLLVATRSEFKSARSSRHLSRIISTQYIFRKELNNRLKTTPEQRHILLKLFRFQNSQGSTKKNVLCLLIGINFLREKEFLEKKHLLHAIQTYVPNVSFREDSFIADRRSTENMSTIYFEVEKTDHEELRIEELKQLKEVLSRDLKERIQHLINPVFMPANEEEIMRDILSLSNEIRYLKDIPQLIITFEEQTHSHLIFMVILVRLTTPENPSVKDCFKMNQLDLEYIHDRIKIIGSLRKKYSKEATVFRVKLKKERFLRSDHTIDLFKARHYVVSELSTVIGEFRDFNGGMIMKQRELLNSIKELLKDEVKYNELLLENFFFSMMPVSMRSLGEPETLKTLFLILLNAIEHGFSSGCNYRIRQDLNSIFILIQIEDHHQKDELNKAFLKFGLKSTDLTQTSLKVNELVYEGYIYHCDEPARQQKFLQVAQTALQPQISQLPCILLPFIKFQQIETSLT